MSPVMSAPINPPSPFRNAEDVAGAPVGLRPFASTDTGMSDRDRAFRIASEEESEHILECDVCDDVVLPIQSTTTKVCCGKEMTPLSDVPTGRAHVRLDDPTHLLHSVFGIGRTAVEICFLVLQANELTAKEIAEETGLDQSGVSRHLKHLTELGLIDRSSKNLRDGGSVHIYSAPASETVRRQPQLLFSCWATDALSILRALNNQKLDLLADRRTAPSQTVYWNRENSKRLLPD